MTGNPGIGLAQRVLRKSIRQLVRDIDREIAWQAHDPPEKPIVERRFPMAVSLVPTEAKK